jgi:uncharacterized protein YrrD/pyrimidine deaminase RibD-like protein
MRKGREIIGKSVVSYDTGERFSSIQDLIFDQNDNRLLGFLVEEAGWFKDARILPLKEVQAIGLDAVVVATKDAVVESHQYDVALNILKQNNILKGTRIMTTDGRDLGTLIDLYFDERTGIVEGYEASGGLFADVYSGRSFVPAPQTLKIGKDVAFVPSQTAELMEEQVGGLKAAMQTASAKVQETAQVTGEQLQEFSQVAREKAQETAQVTGDKLQDAKRAATVSATNAVISPEEQKTFVVGKVATQSVSSPEGNLIVVAGQVITRIMAQSAHHLGVLDALYRSAGGNISDRLTERFERRVAPLAVEQALGRRVRTLVRANEGSIIAAPGQIVTEQIVERAKQHHREQPLLDAVGLSTSDAIRDQGSFLTRETGERFRTATQDTGSQIQSGAQSLWLQVKETANDLQERSTQAIEEKRIKGALGRPVNRVILDRQDGVILNTGELITHEAIEQARQSDVLDLLLNSVYTETPKLSLGDLRAPVPGQAAL